MISRLALTAVLAIAYQQSATDEGKITDGNWEIISTGNEAERTEITLASDPMRSGALLALTNTWTEGGVVRRTLSQSFSAGRQWDIAASGLPDELLTAQANKSNIGALSTLGGWSYLAVSGETLGGIYVREGRSDWYLALQAQRLSQVTVAHQNPSTAYVGGTCLAGDYPDSDRWILAKTDNYGQRWADISPLDCRTELGKHIYHEVNNIVEDPDNQIIYVTTMTFLVNDVRVPISRTLFRSHDAGASWTTLASPPGPFPTDLIAAPISGRLFAGPTTSDWFYSSEDFGSTWQEYTPNLDANSNRFRRYRPTFDRAENPPTMLWPDDTSIYSSSDDGVSWRYHAPMPQSAKGRSTQLQTDGSSPGTYYLVSGWGHPSTLAEIFAYNPPAPIAPIGLVNMSSLARSEQGLLAGVIIQGASRSELLFKAEILSGRESSVSGDTTLALYKDSGELFHFNDNWQTDRNAQMLAGLAPPERISDAAFVIDLAPGHYIAKMETTGNTEPGLLSITATSALDHALTQSITPSPGPVNLSTLGPVHADATGDTLKSGFVIQGEEPTRVLIAAQGYEYNNAPAVDPIVTLTTIDGLHILANDNWPQADSADEVQHLINPQSVEAAAFAVTLPAGGYVAEVKSHAGQNGWAIISVTSVCAFSDTC